MANYSSLFAFPRVGNEPDGYELSASPKESMSKLMLVRVRRLRLTIPSDVSTNQLDQSFERVTGQDCDKAAVQMTDMDFRRAIEKAILLVRRGKKKQEAAAVV